MSEIKSFLYDADGNETEDESRAVHGRTVELGDDGEIVAEIESWQVDGAALHGDAGELATRPDA